jgi:glycosyltransferase involved in cell wall biosynthesis
MDEVDRVSDATRVRILAMMEAGSVTGPAKNLIGFCRWLATPEGAQTGISIAIATFDRNPGSDGGGFARAARAAGIDTHVIREKYRFDPGVVAQLRNIVAAERPTIIQTHNGKSHLLIKSLPSLRAQRVWFAFQHGYQDTNFKLNVYNQLDRLSLRAAARVVSVCQAFTSRLIAYGVKPERIRVLHNSAVKAPSVPDSERRQLLARLGVSEHDAVILTIGRLSREKGHADLLRALAQMGTPHRDWKMVLVGIGPEREALETLADSLGLGKRIVFAGFHADVSSFYAIADLFVLPSRSEGSSNVLLEAMMAGVPIVATSAGGNPEIVLNEQTGLLTPVDDPAALAGAMGRVLGEPTLASRFAEAALSRAVNEFSLDRYRRRLVGFYAEALQTALPFPQT